MRTTYSAFILTCVLVVAGETFVLGQTKYGVTVQEAKTAELAKVKTYAWTAGQPSSDKNVDAQIMAAIDRELGTLGLTKVATGSSDVLATYASQRRTDVDLKAAKGSAGREFPVGILLVELRDPATRQPLFRARIDKPLDAERDKLEAAINEAVKEMFEKYPTRAPAKR